MNKHLALIKVGGSFITDKSVPFTAKPANIQLFADQFAAAYRNNPDIDFIVGNGVGSFGHASAQQYGLRSGAAIADQTYGTAVTHNGARRINSMVAEALAEQGVPAFGLSPAGFMLYDHARVISSYFEVITQLLVSRSVPLLHGDTMIDTLPGTTIASTEMILQLCLEAFRASYDKITVIYIMNTDGVLDNNGKTIAALTTTEKIHIYKKVGFDVSNSINGKIASARKAAHLADTVYLISGNSKDGLQAVLAGKQIGTLVT